MEETVGRLVIWAVGIIGALALVVGFLYASLWLLGRVLKYLGYYKMFLQTMGRMAQEGKFRKDGKRPK